jgi:hypothetical protein
MPELIQPAARRSVRFQVEPGEGMLPALAFPGRYTNTPTLGTTRKSSLPLTQVALHRLCVVVVPIPVRTAIPTRAYVSNGLGVGSADRNLTPHKLWPRLNTKPRIVDDQDKREFVMTSTRSRERKRRIELTPAFLRCSPGHDGRMRPTYTALLNFLCPRNDNQSAKQQNTSATVSVVTPNSKNMERDLNVPSFATSFSKTIHSRNDTGGCGH